MTDALHITGLKRGHQAPALVFSNLLIDGIPPASAITIEAAATDETWVDPLIFPLDLLVNDYVEMVVGATGNGKYLLDYKAANTDINPSPAVPGVILAIQAIG